MRELMFLAVESDHAPNGLDRDMRVIFTDFLGRAAPLIVVNDCLSEDARPLDNRLA